MTFAARVAAGPRPLVCAHRGASAAVPENTMAAFAAALDEGVTAIELDVHLSADAVPMVVHDATLERTTSGGGPVGALPAAALGALDAGSWRDPRWASESIPRLAEVLDLCRGRALVLVEVKEAFDPGGRAAAAVVGAVREAGVVDDALVLAFDHRHLAAARALEPALGRVALCGERPADPAGLLHELGAVALAPAWRVVDAGLVATVHAGGAAVVAWTVDEVEDALRLAADGVDVLISNRPGAIAAALRSGQSAGRPRGAGPRRAR